MHIFEVLVSFFSKVLSLCRFCKSNAGRTPLHKCEAIYWHRRDWRFMEKLYLYFDRFWPVSWQLQHRFLLCSAVHHGLARNWLFQTVVRTTRGSSSMLLLRQLGTRSQAHRNLPWPTASSGGHASILDWSPNSKASRRHIQK